MNYQELEKVLQGPLPILIQVTKINRTFSRKV